MKHAESSFDFRKLKLPVEAMRVLEASPRVTWAGSAQELVDAAVGGPGHSSYEVRYDVPGRGSVLEATVVRVRNGIVGNYPEPYMRRRDPDCMVVADDRPTDKQTYRDRFKSDFGELRKATFDWLASQELMAFAFTAGQDHMGVDAMVIAPANAGFFALGLALLQGITPREQLGPDFAPRAIIYVAPPFRHTHFNGKQIVVHARQEHLHELFAYNLYPGPSAKKGIYGVLINLGEAEGWITAHCSTVQVVTPYDNTVTIMHEGASGGGKSEMLEQIHREPDGRLRLGRNVVTGEVRYLEIPRACELEPVTDDMALCHPSLQQEGGGKLRVADAENAWFVRVNHITEYCTDPFLEKLCAQPPQPLLFLSIDAVPNSRALIWEHIQDAPGVPCPNPRVILPRAIVPNVVTEPVTVDIRSFGVRTPPCTKSKPTYGIIGLLHILPPALAWLWRLVAPRGHANPSITQSEALSSEGVGSYWPFATGLRVDQANLLLEQIRQTPRTRYILTPNQHLGAWECGYAPQWVAREYLARRGSAKFRSDKLVPARCPLLGYALDSLQIEGKFLPRWFLQINLQADVGDEAYDVGAVELQGFFVKQLNKFTTTDLSPLGRRIIDACLSGASIKDYADLLPQE